MGWSPVPRCAVAGSIRHCRGRTSGAAAFFVSSANALSLPPSMAPSSPHPLPSSPSPPPPPLVSTDLPPLYSTVASSRATESFALAVATSPSHCWTAVLLLPPLLCSAAAALFCSPPSMSSASHSQQPGPERLTIASLAPPQRTQAEAECKRQSTQGLLVGSGAALGLAYLTHKALEANCQPPTAPHPLLHPLLHHHRPHCPTVLSDFGTDGAHRVLPLPPLGGSPHLCDDESQCQGGHGSGSALTPHRTPPLDCRPLSPSPLTP